MLKLTDWFRAESGLVSQVPPNPSKETVLGNGDTRGPRKVLFRRRDWILWELSGTMLRTIGRYREPERPWQSEWSPWLCLSQGDTPALRCGLPATSGLRTVTPFSGERPSLWGWLLLWSQHSSKSRLLTASRAEPFSFLDPCEIIFSPVWNGLTCF